MSASDRVSDVSQRCAGMEPVVICIHMYAYDIYMYLLGYVRTYHPWTAQRSTVDFP